VIGVYQHASGKTLDPTNPTGTPINATASINGLDPSATSNQVAARVGIRHKF